MRNKIIFVLLSGLLVFSLIRVDKIYAINVSNSAVPRKCTQNENPCDPDSCSYNPDKCEKQVPGQSHFLGSQHVADKIITHGYLLIDAYIKELPGFTCVFSDGQFNFVLGNGAKIDLSPACAYGKIWRNISFRNPDGSAQIIVLDGPVSGEPGTPNENAIAEVKDILARGLSESNMIVKVIYKNAPDLEFNLSSHDDFQAFIELMYDSIQLSAPLASGPTPAEITLPGGTLIRANPVPEDDKKPFEVNDIPSDFEKIDTTVNFGGKEKGVAVKTGTKELKIEIDNVIAITKKKIEIKDSNLYLETSAGLKQVKILPKQASIAFSEITEVKEIELKQEAAKPVYAVKGTKKAKLLFIFPVTVKIETKIDAENGEIIAVKKPWWSFLAW